MSIFGKLDAATVKTNPFFVEQGEYEAEVTACNFNVNKDNIKQLRIEYTITSAESTYRDYKVVTFIDLVDAEMTNEQLALMPTAELTKIRRNMALLKRTLCGSDGNDRQHGLGVDVDDLNGDNWDPETVKGTKVNLGITNFGTDGVQVKWVNTRD